MATTVSLPVLLYHYISKHKDSIAVPPDQFNEHCRGMAAAGYRGVGLDQAVEYLRDGRPLPAKSVLITFDDGYLDNYVYAWPILAAHGHQGTVFAVTAKLEEPAPPRPTATESGPGASRARVDQPFHPGALGLPERKDLFLNWTEAQRLEDSGAMQVAAHSHRHNSVFRGPFFKGERRLVKPEPRTRTFDRVDSPMPLGLPRFATAPGLSARGFLVSDELLHLVRKTVPQDLGDAANFFRTPSNEAALWKRIDALGAEGWGRMESEDEYRQRVYDDLAACRATIDRHLGHADAPRRQALAWPWGAFSATALEIGRELGFRVFFATTFGANPPGRRPEQVHRFKARDKTSAWLLGRLFIYSRPLVAAAYAALRI